MKLLILECSAEELRANRTVMDTLNETLSSFTRPMFGVDIDVSKLDYEESEDDNNEYVRPLFSKL